MPAYATTIYADAYYATRLAKRAAPWTRASSQDRIAALVEATQAIDNLNFAGHKHDESNQVNQFPRGNDTIVPDEVSRACCELALAFLDDVDANLEAENLQNTHVGTSGARVVRDSSYVQEHIRAGIPSLQAWNLLIPFMRSTAHPRIELLRGD